MLRPGVGIGLRPEIAGDLLRDPGAVDLVEVVAERCLAVAEARREARAVARIWPVVPHGVKLSLGSAAGIDAERARRLGALARELSAPAISEHVAFVRGGGREIGHLTPLPRTVEAARVVARNVAKARRSLPNVPLFLENPAWTLRWPEDDLDEGSFYTEIVERTGCDLLLDLGNVYANAVNAGVDPRSLLLSYPLERVGMIHLAGGAVEGGFYYDTHAHPVPEAVFGLLEAALDRAGAVPIILERDAVFPPFAELAAEVQRARALVEHRSARSLPRAGSRTGAGAGGRRSDDGGRRDGALDQAQARLAALLTSSEAPAPGAARPFADEEVARARSVLLRKRRRSWGPAQECACSRREDRS